MNKELKLGIIGLDTSHVIVFSDAFNNPAAKSPVAGAKVVTAWPGGSHDLESSIGRVAGYTKDLQEKFAPIGFLVEPGTSEALAQRSKLETAKWAKAIRDAKIEPQ